MAELCDQEWSMMTLWFCSVINDWTKWDQSLRALFVQHYVVSMRLNGCCNKKYTICFVQDLSDVIDQGWLKPISLELDEGTVQRVWILKMLIEIRSDRTTESMVLLILIDVILLNPNVIITPLRGVHRSCWCCSDDGEINPTFRSYMCLDD